MSHVTPMILEALSSLRYLRVRFELRSLSECRLPGFLGSTLRGALAMSFRRMVCTFDMRPCDGCPVQRTCPYPALFETPAATGTQAVRRMRDIPHPILIVPPLRHAKRYRPGDTLAFEIVLLGQAAQRLPYLIFAVNEMAGQGLGVKRGPFHLAGVTDGDGQPLYDVELGQLLRDPTPRNLGEILHGEAPESVRVILETPLRVKAEGSLLAREIDAADFLRPACRRLWSLIRFHGHDPQGEWDFHSLWEKEKLPELLDRNLRWWDLSRYSNRQKNSLKIGGLTGHFTLRGNLQPWWGILRAVELVHLGKGTIMGLGRIRLRPMTDGESWAPSI
ncbi:MAG: CRISPR system precrRNA processing endoribonuclease RAMP protein Cas6 [bacterium]